MMDAFMIWVHFRLRLYGAQLLISDLAYGYAFTASSVGFIPIMYLLTGYCSVKIIPDIKVI